MRDCLRGQTAAAVLVAACLGYAEAFLPPTVAPSGLPVRAPAVSAGLQRTAHPCASAQATPRVAGSALPVHAGACACACMCTCVCIRAIVCVPRVGMLVRAREHSCMHARMGCTAVLAAKLFAPPFHQTA